MIQVTMLMKLYFPLQESFKKLFKWFADNQMKTNEGKGHIIVSTNELNEIQIKIGAVKSN